MTLASDSKVLRNFGVIFSGSARLPLMICRTRQVDAFLPSHSPSRFARVHNLSHLAGRRLIRRNQFQRHPLELRSRAVNP
jgi:hypothetical protein